MSRPEANLLARTLMQQLHQHLGTCPMALAPPQVVCDIQTNKLLVTGTLPFAARMPSAQVDAFLRGVRAKIRLPGGRSIRLERLDHISGTVTLSIDLTPSDH